MAREKRTLTIGELSRRTAVPVKTLRYYSDEGLLPPTGRTQAGYRVYAEDSVARLELIRALRDAGLGIERIREVVSRKLSLAEALRQTLVTVEAHLRSLKHVASALRAALRSEPTEHDIRRLCAVTKLSNEERRKVIEEFYEEVARGTTMDEGWKRRMIEASVPALPDEPTPEQLDAWIELSEIVQDAGFRETMRASVRFTWTPGFDHVGYTKAAERMAAEREGLAPESAEAKGVVERCFAGFAAAMGRAPDETFRRELRRQYDEMDPRATRYWELVARTKGQAPRPPSPEWEWFRAASRHHFP